MGASLNSLSGGVSASHSMYANSQYNYYMSGLLPSTPDVPDSSSLAYFYRDIYLHDNTAGSCVDIQSVFPFSDWELRGLDEGALDVYNTALERLNLRELLPQASVAYLTDGFYAGSLVFDARSKNFMDILTHDAISCGITASPFNNVDPAIRVSVSGAVSQFLNSSSDYARQYMDTMPKNFLDLLNQGSFTLDPVTTLFVGRRALTDRAYQSYLHRILPMYLIEKTMYRGTLIEANRRQRAMSHVTAGDDIWTPTSEELGMLVQQFQAAEQDPLGGWISTRNGVQVSDLRPGGDFWKWTDMTDTMVAYKLRALGISEALLSGDASYASAESAYSTFLETVNAYRTHLTNNIFNRKLFPLLAVANGLYKDKAKRHGNEKVVDFLFNTSNRQNLKMPTLHWHKDLTTKNEDNMMEMLEKVGEVTGMSFPLKTWLAAAGVDKDTLIRDQREDAELRKSLGLPPSDGKHHDEGGEDGGESEFDPGEARVNLTSTAVSSALARLKRKPILSRTFGDDEGELTSVTRTGKKKMVYNQSGKQKDAHHKISKIAARVAKDAAYRNDLVKRNLEKFGTSVLNVAA